MGSTRQKYSLAFKLQALELVKQRCNLIEVAQELNISYETLKNWKKGLYIGKETDNVLPKVKEDKELTLLDKELYETKLERDILKRVIKP